MYIQCIYMYIHCTWLPHIPSELHLHLSVCLENLLKQLVIPCTYMVYTCTYSGYTCTYIELQHLIFYKCTVLRYFPLQTCLYRLQEAIYNAIVQESAFLYIPCSYTYIHSKNGSGMWSAFLGHFCKNVSGSVWQHLS